MTCSYTISAFLISAQALGYTSDNRELFYKLTESAEMYIKYKREINPFELGMMSEARNEILVKISADDRIDELNNYINKHYSKSWSYGRDELNDYTNKHFY